MPDTMTVEVDDRRVRAALDDLARGLDDLDSGLEDVGRRVVDDMRPLVPVLTGALVDTVSADVTSDSVEISVGSASVVYGRFIDQGLPSRGIKAVHFTDRAAERAPDAAVAELGDAIDDLIRSTGLR